MFLEFFYDLYTMNVDGTGMQQLTQTPEDEHFPQYPPSGKKIAFILKEERGSEICIMNSDGEGRNIIVSPPTYIIDKAILPISPCYPVWSPERKEIVFMLGSHLFLVQTPSADSKGTTILGIMVIGIVLLLIVVWVRLQGRSK